MEKEQDYYFTFCGDHQYPRSYVKIHGTYGSARAEMFKHFGDKWGFQYTEEQFGDQAERFGLTELKRKENK